MPGGRPTDYRPEYCEQVVEHCREGATLTSFAASIGNHRQALYRWQEQHPEFRDACARARTACQQWWEAAFRDGIKKREFQANAAMTFMSAIFDDFRPQAAKLEIEHKGQVQIRSLPREELLRLAGEAIIDAEVLEKPAALPAPADAEPPKISQT